MWMVDDVLPLSVLCKPKDGVIFPEPNGNPKGDLPRWHASLDFVEQCWKAHSEQGVLELQCRYRSAS